MDDSYQIVIADDHPLFRSAMVQAIASTIGDCDIHECDCAQSLLKYLNDAKEPDLLLLDLKMPDAQGFSLFSRVHNLYPHLAIVVVSANDDPKVIERAKQLGASGFIPKSSPLKQLIQAINSVIAGNTWFAQSMRQSDNEDTLNERLTTLTPQQYRVLVMLNEGLLNKQIAYDLGVSEATIKAHVTAIFRKLKVKSRTQAVIALQQLEFEP